MMWFNNWAYGLGSIFMIFFWILLIFIIARIIRCSLGYGNCARNVSSHYNCCEHNKENGALDILKERYAKGEITKEQYEEMKKNL